MLRQNSISSIFIRPQRVQALVWFFLFTVSATLNIATVNADIAKSELAVAPWKPIVWETTSSIALCMLVPALYWLSRRLPFDRRQWPRWFAIHLGLSFPFSFAHVALMGAMREFAYAFTDVSYDFLRLVSVEFLYEYRKDVFTYLVLLALVYIIRRAFASPLKHEKLSPAAPAKLRLATDGGDAFIVTAEVEALEAAGNYVIVTTQSGSCECRASLSGLLEKMNGDVVRIHRSCAVGRNHIRSIRTNHSGDGEIDLASGKTVRFSRRYKAQLMASLDRTQSGSANAMT